MKRRYKNKLTEHEEELISSFLQGFVYGYGLVADDVGAANEEKAKGAEQRWPGSLVPAFGLSSPEV